MPFQITGLEVVTPSSAYCKVFLSFQNNTDEALVVPPIVLRHINAKGKADDRSHTFGDIILPEESWFLTQKYTSTPSKIALLTGGHVFAAAAPDSLIHKFIPSRLKGMMLGI